jgi:RimJ/RimL family protein N-acetyltransferase
MKLHLAPDILRGRSIQLEPYDDSLKQDLRAVLDCDPEGWQLFATSGQGKYFENWWTTINANVASGHWVAFAIRDLASRAIVGTSSFLNIKPERCTAEIGATFLHPTVRSGYVNPEAKRLMLAYAFALGARRIELLTDLRNVRSQAAIAKLGAVREGVLRRDRQTWTGHIRDSVIFSITDLDWPDVRRRLDERLSAIPTAAISP